MPHGLLPRSTILGGGLPLTALTDVAILPQYCTVTRYYPLPGLTRIVIRCPSDCLLSSGVPSHQRWVPPRTQITPKGVINVRLRLTFLGQCYNRGGATSSQKRSNGRSPFPCVMKCKHFLFAPYSSCRRRVSNCHVTILVVHHVNVHTLSTLS